MFGLPNIPNEWDAFTVPNVNDGLPSDYLRVKHVRGNLPDYSPVAAPPWTLPLRVNVPHRDTLSVNDPRLAHLPARAPALPPL